MFRKDHTASPLRPAGWVAMQPAPAKTNPLNSPSWRVAAASLSRQERAPLPPVLLTVQEWELRGGRGGGAAPPTRSSPGGPATEVTAAAGAAGLVVDAATLLPGAGVPVASVRGALPPLGAGHPRTRSE